MSKRHMVTLHHLINFYSDIFDHIDGIMKDLAKKQSQWKEDLYCAMEFVQQKLSNYYAEVTEMTWMLLISAHSLDPFWQL